MVLPFLTPTAQQRIERVRSHESLDRTYRQPLKSWYTDSRRCLFQAMYERKALQQRTPREFAVKHLSSREIQALVANPWRSIHTSLSFRTTWSPATLAETGLATLRYDVNSLGMCSTDSTRLSLFHLRRPHTRHLPAMKLALAAAFALEVASTVHAIAFGTIDPAKKLKRSHFENLVKRQSFTTGTANDSIVLNDALALQHLEASFYAEGLAKFDQNSFDQAGYYNVRPLLEQVAQDEAEHVKFFTTVLKAANISAVQTCNYTCMFDRSPQLDTIVKHAEALTQSCAVPYEDVTEYLRLAQVLENVVVSAFHGAATSFPESPRPSSGAGAGATGELSGNCLV